LRVHVKLYGVLKTAAKTERLELEFESPISIRQLVNKLVSVIARPEFETYLIDADTKDPRPNALILVSGTEIGALNGIDSTLRDGDEVVFLPVAHGG
jgi:molybdopterin synthase sulfur carrier subunit